MEKSKVKSQKSKLQYRSQKHPDFLEEQKLWRQGCRFVVGLDEVGRGPLAGPVVASAVCFLSVIPAKVVDLDVRRAGIQTKESGSRVKPGMTKWEKIRDSKKLSARQRERWYKILTTSPEIKYGIGIVSEKIIDKINIFEATKLAMKKAIDILGNEPDFLLLDGNFTLEDVSINQKAIVRGDEKVFSIAAASIIAKVTRDRMMCQYAKKYPQYGFEKHKGYGTKLHIDALKRHGACKIHRRSFRPVKS